MTQCRKKMIIMGNLNLPIRSALPILRNISIPCRRTRASLAFLGIFLLSLTRYRKRVYPLMKSIATDAIRSTFMKMDPNRVEYGFELYGMDYMIDENYKVWIIEFNTNPALTVNCPV
jgi:hypothetical protein